MHFMNARSLGSCPSREQLAALLREHLNEGDQQILAAHVDECSSCQQALIELAGQSRSQGEELDRWRQLLGQKSEEGNEQSAITRLAPSAEFLRRLRGIAREVDDSVSLTGPLDSGRLAVGSVSPLPQLPGYQVLRELGRGGMSVVYLARQESLNRLVALKMILAGVGANPEYRTRLRNEAEAVARLRHPNIVQIYEIGEYEVDSSGLDPTARRPFLSLEYVEGGSLYDCIDKTPQAPGAAARLTETLARTMQYAHEQGVIHRDLKPANILLQRVSKERNWDASSTGNWFNPSGLLTTDYAPKITDFGIAKCLDTAGPTRTGAILGTPSYMAPEQAGGKGEIGPRTDVYALGAILYELLTGRPPFWAADPLDTLFQVRFQQPILPTVLQPSVPRDLETICLKCLHKEPARRYSTAHSLAEDLRRFQAGESIRARPAGFVEKVAGSIRRHPLAAGSLAACVLAVGAGFAGTVYGYVTARAALTAEQSALTAEAEKRRETEKTLYFTYISLTEELWRENDMREAEATLSKCSPQEGEIDHRGWEWFYLNRLLHAKLVTFMGTRAPSRDVAEIPAGKRLQRGVELRNIDQIDFAADGKELILDSHQSREVRRLEFRTGNLLGRMPLPMAPPQASASGGHRMAMAGHFLAAPSAEDAREAKVWDGRTAAPSTPVAREVGVYRGHTVSIKSLTLTEDASLLATAGWEPHRPQGPGTNQTPEIKIWDVATGRELLGWNADGEGEILHMAFSRQDPKSKARYLATGWQDGTVRVWDCLSGKEVLAAAGHEGGVGHVAFDRDGTRLASAGLRDCKLCIWDTTTGRRTFALHGHKHGITSLAFSPDGKRLASIDDSGEVRLWDPMAGQQALTLPVLVGGSQKARPEGAGFTACVMFSPDGRYIVSNNREGSINVWDDGEQQE
jgi:serine/threonine protein kinase/WD40 repeat protein